MSVSPPTEHYLILMVGLIIYMEERGNLDSASRLYIADALTDMHQSRLKQIYPTGNIVFGILCVICSILQISCGHAQRDHLIYERREDLSGPITSILHRLNPRSVEILVHATSDAIDYDHVCANILKEFPTKILKFEDQTVSKIPPRMRLHEDLVVLYFYIGYECPNQEESAAVVERMRKLYWWFLRVKVLLVTSTVIDCYTIKYLFEESWKYGMLPRVGITSTDDVITYHKYHPYENSYKRTNVRNHSDIIPIHPIPDMFGKQIRSTAVNDPPLTLAERDNKTGVIKLEGLGYEILKEVCKILNATYFIVPKRKKIKLWHKNVAINITFESIMTGRADINPRGLHMFDYGKDFDEFEFTEAIYYDEVWAMIPKNQDQPVSQLKNLFFDLYLVVALVILVWAIALLFRFRSFVQDPLLIFAILMGSTCPRVPVPSSHRILLCAWISSTMILSGHFQTFLTHCMSFKQMPRDIETLEELEASGRDVLMFGSVIDIAYASVEDKGPYITRLRNRTIPGPHGKYCAQKLLNSWSTNVSCTPGTYQANSYINTMLKNGRQALTITKERFFGSWQAFIVRRGIHWIGHMRKVILDFQKAGLIKKWLTDHVIHKTKPDPPFTFSPLTMNTFALGLTIIAWCYSLCVLAFVFEHMYFHCHKNVVLWFPFLTESHNWFNDQTTQ